MVCLRRAVPAVAAALGDAVADLPCIVPQRRRHLIVEPEGARDMPRCADTCDECMRSGLRRPAQPAAGAQRAAGA
ncbi:hypothetical protein A6R71_02285 [Xanthomonas translucens pv. arrhenatheri]|uniref:Uncharacterized protein n=1 Tax=Xanthomonas graminis pv. arrhenatheri LMG 727 TaxID=1195923 RepID=A0A0K2ZW16_9XANT|nr:hypothetical protein A6R71_02285 [Xanthomonas translucens pv. arrhenatheri]CTP87485.1 hypothetical protein XTALMG727_2040 [Xanthomonas translucens pv. arrhenatheri LMG 727]